MHKVVTGRAMRRLKAIFSPQSSHTSMESSLSRDNLLVDLAEQVLLAIVQAHFGGEDLFFHGLVDGIAADVALVIHRIVQRAFAHLGQTFPGRFKHATKFVPSQHSLSMISSRKVGL